MQKTHIQLLILFGTLLLYLLVKGASPAAGAVVGILIGVEIFTMVGLEIRSGARESGWKHEIIDTLLALLVAVAIWFAASFVLNTSSPISAVVSCSMLPNLYRGDFVVVQGAPVAAYNISMSPADFSGLSGGVASVSWNGTERRVNGSMYSYCMYYGYEPVCKAFVSSPESVTERTGPLTYHYGECGISYTDKPGTGGPCVTSVEYRGKEYLMNHSHDIIVYRSDAHDLYSRIGDIVHRAVFVIDVNGETFYLTRGDNNPILDAQVFDYSSGAGNTPVAQRNVKGKVLFRIPLLGYFKLFISGFYAEDPQCSTQLGYGHV